MLDLYNLTGFIFDTLNDLVVLIQTNWLFEIFIFLYLVSRVAKIFKRRFL